MTDLTDLVKRLREANRAYKFVPECGEAADAIEVLEAERDETKAVWLDAETRAQQAEADLAAARAALQAVQDLIDASYGVAGLHLNGDVAPWSDLLAGGCYEEWLVLFSDAIAAARAEGGE